MKVNVKSIALIVLFFIACVGSSYYIGERTRTKIAFVDNVKLFNEFSLKKELEIKLKQVKKLRDTSIDSLQVFIQLKNKQFSQNKKLDKNVIHEFEILKQHLQLKMDQTEEDNIALTKQYDRQIWKQLNEYVKQYALERNFDFILGSSGNGNLMHAAEESDLTKEMVEYVNFKYNGK